MANYVASDVPVGGLASLGRNHFVYAPSQWETTLQCNVVPYYVGAYTE